MIKYFRYYLMTESQEPNTQLQHAAPLLMRALKGAGFATILLVFTYTLLEEPNTGSSRWVVVPLILVPFAGGLGGAVFYITDILWKQDGWRKTLTNTMSVLAYWFLILAAFMIGMNGPH